MNHARMMQAATSGLLVIDVQEKLLALLPDRERLLLNLNFLLDAAALFGIQVQATEQYPRGLGATVPELARRLPSRLDKLAFSCCALPEVPRRFWEAGRTQILVAGIEAHVCVLQTALDLLRRDFEVYIAIDAVSSRFASDKEIAARRLEQAGCVLTSVEAAAFEWAGQAGTDSFRSLSKLIQERMRRLAELPENTPWRC